MKIASTLAGLFGTDNSMKRRNTTLNRSVVRDFEIEEFAGVWYEIARIGNDREEGLSHVSATFVVDAEGAINLRTEGFNQRKGTFEITRSKVNVPNAERQATMKVASFIPFAGREINILEVDADYNFALIGGRTADELWIASRAPFIPAEDLSYLVARALERGYDISNLVFPDNCAVISQEELLVAAV